MIEMASCLYLTNWLREEVSPGVKRINTYLPLVPLMAVTGHAQPADVAIVTCPYYPGDNASNKCAVNDAPSAHPALYLDVEGPTVVEGEVRTIFRDGKVRLVVRYIVAKANPARSRVEASYTMKALELAVYDWLLDDATGRAARGDDGTGKVVVINAELTEGGIVYGEWDEDVGESKANQIMTIALDRVRDTSHA
jgi:hypothetical protein